MRGGDSGQGSLACMAPLPGPPPTRIQGPPNHPPRSPHRGLHSGGGTWRGQLKRGGHESEQRTPAIKRSLPLCDGVWLVVGQNGALITMGADAQARLVIKHSPSLHLPPLPYIHFRLSHSAGDGGRLPHSRRRLLTSALPRLQRPTQDACTSPGMIRVVPYPCSFTHQALSSGGLRIKSDTGVSRGLSSVTGS